MIRKLETTGRRDKCNNAAVELMTEAAGHGGMWRCERVYELGTEDVSRHCYTRHPSFHFDRLVGFFKLAVMPDPSWLLMLGSRGGFIFSGFSARGLALSMSAILHDKADVRQCTRLVFPLLWVGILTVLLSASDTRT